jgi:ribonuclease P protein component
LAKDADIKRVLSARRSFFTPFLTMKVVLSPLGRPRITIVVSTKVSKLAVKRNRLKRVIRSEIQPLLSLLPSVDMLFRVKPGILGQDESRIRSELRFLLNKLKLLK